MKIKLEGEIIDQEEENKKIIDERVRDDKEKEKKIEVGGGIMIMKEKRLVVESRMIKLKLK